MKLSNFRTFYRKSMKSTGTINQVDIKEVQMKLQKSPAVDLMFKESILEETLDIGAGCSTKDIKEKSTFSFFGRGFNFRDKSLKKKLNSQKKTQMKQKIVLSRSEKLKYLKNHSSPMKKIGNYKDYNRIKEKVVKERQVMSDNLSYQQKIHQYFFRKNAKYFYSNKVSIQEVIKKIYYEKYRYEDLVDYVIHCFKKITSVREFFEVLIKEASKMAQSIKKEIMMKLNSFFKEEPNLKKQQLQYQFTKKQNRYLSLINELYEYYKNLENINYEIEKLTLDYLKNCVEHGKHDTYQDTLKFHRRLFINCIFKDAFIYHFISSLLKYFKLSTFHYEHFKEAYQKLQEIFIQLDLHQEEKINSSTTQTQKQNTFIQDESSEEETIYSSEINVDSKQIEEEAFQILKEEREKEKRRKKNQKRKQKQKKKKQAQKEMIKLEELEEMKKRLNNFDEEWGSSCIVKVVFSQEEKIEIKNLIN